VLQTLSTILKVMANVTRFLPLAAAVLATLPSPAATQDIRGIEVCTAEKQMERRTSCLQANVEFLQQALSSLTHETERKMAAADRDLATARAEIAALKSTVEKLTRDLAKTKGNAAVEGKK
jgi:predicted RNase H-like nuclease (RuvC/YqgF family)